MQIQKSLEMLEKFFPSFVWFFSLGLIFFIVSITPDSVLLYFLIPSVGILTIACYKWISSVPDFFDKSSSIINKILVCLVALFLAGLSTAFMPIIYYTYK
jgi:hypothetical protein